VEITFTKVKLPWGWLSNMSPHPIDILGTVWPTAEHLFQALRFDVHSPIREEIRAQKSPMTAKMVAKRYVDQMTKVPRSREDLDSMRLVLLLKVEEHPDLKTKLLGTGDAVIIENVTARPNESGLFWGAARNPDGTWRGNNALGKEWMTVRWTLRLPRPVESP